MTHPRPPVGASFLKAYEGAPEPASGAGPPGRPPLPSGNDPLSLRFIEFWNWGAFFWGWIWALVHRLWLWGLGVFLLQVLAQELLVPRLRELMVALPGRALQTPPGAAAGMTLLLLVPFLANVPLAMVGSRLAWRHRPFPGGMEEFLEVQRRWAFWGWWITLPIVVLVFGFTWIVVRDLR